jgi:hypothetical protein
MTYAQPRPTAPFPASEYTLTIDEVGELYANAGFARPTRRLQKYCARGDLDCRKVETLSGEKYLITPISVERHIALIAQTQGAAGRDQARPDASITSDISVFDHPYVRRLEREVEEFKGKYEGQVRRTEQVLETANRNLIELAQANAIAQSETLARYMLASGEGKRAPEGDGEADADVARAGSETSSAGSPTQH